MSVSESIGLQNQFTAADLAPMLPMALRELIMEPSQPARTALTAGAIDPWDLLDRAVDYAAAAEQIIADQSARIAELEQMALTDPLTGLSNRRGFENALATALDMNRRHGETAVLIYVDLDGFKQINDTYGHDAGDRLLQHVAALLKAELRASDAVARIGGDEFAALLRRADPREGSRRALAIRERLNTGSIALGSKRLPVRASLGVDVASGEDSVGQALRRADMAMYRDKRTRRATRN
tara:strand:- start:954 stop:1670 length:717 start_codon:yes stop_codon:yes gene_type:complete